MTLRNTSSHLAFQVRLAVREKDGAEILPVFWDDNYIALMPGESRQITAHYHSPQALNDASELIVSGWNIEPQKVALRERKTGASGSSRK